MNLITAALLQEQKMRLQGFIDKSPAPVYTYTVYQNHHCIVANVDHDRARHYFNTLDGYVTMVDNNGHCADFKGGCKPEPESYE